MPRPPNVFSGPYLDRIAHVRKDQSWLRDALAAEGTVLVPVWDSKCLVQRGPSGLAAAYLDVRRASAHAAFAATDGFVLLGQVEGRTYFAVELDAPEPALALYEEGTARFEDLRVAGSQLEIPQAGVVAYARAMLHWRRRHRHCGVCGSVTRPTQAGHVMRCTNEACATDHFPRLDPAIIVLVTDGERALLGRQASWPAGRYSTIAGFVEPGESLEDAVAREVLEETGVRVDAAEYHSSQPWPFPSSLMVGFMATASGEAVPRADDELEDVRWFTREEIASGAAGIPPSLSVSYRLIEDWYDAGSPTPLRDAPGVRRWSAARR